MYKLAFNSISPPTAFAVLGSLGAHVLLGISLPILPIYSQDEPGPLEVPLVELTPEEMARIPALQAPPPIAFIPPNATQLLPVPQNFQLPSASSRPTPTTPATPAIPVAPTASTSPALPSKPSAGEQPYNYPTFTRPQRVVIGSPGGSSSRSGLPLTPSRPVIGGRSSTGRSVTSSENFRNSARSVEASRREFKPDPSADPMKTWNDSIEQSRNQNQEPNLPNPGQSATRSIDPAQIRPVAPVNGTQTTVTTPAIPLPVNPEHGAIAPSKPSETPSTPANPNRGARSSNDPNPTPHEPEFTQPTNENRDRPPTENREAEEDKDRKQTTSTDSNNSQNNSQRDREPENQTPRNGEEATSPRRQESNNQPPREREQATQPPRRQEPNNQPPRDREEAAQPPRNRNREEAISPRNREQTSSPRPQEYRERSTAENSAPATEQPKVNKTKPATPESNDTDPAQ